MSDIEKRVHRQDDDATDRYNPLALARFVPQSQKSAQLLGKVNRLLGSVSGLDRVLMLVQYGGPLLAALLTKSNPLSRRLDQLSAGKGLIGARRAGLAQSLSLLATKLSDARMLLRFAGLFPIISWMLSLERPETAPADRTTRNVQRLQVWSMLAYYPAEHIYYLAANNIISIAPAKKLQAILWACRAWGVYVFLQLYLYSSQARVLSAKMAKLAAQRRAGSSEKALSTEKDQEKVNTDALVESAEEASEDARLMMQERACMTESDALVNGVMTNLAYAPLTVHWSLPNGIFTNELWSNVFMVTAGLSSLRANWKALG